MSEQEGIYRKMMDHRVSEITAREQVVELVKEIHSRKLWQTMGYASIGDFCQKYGGYAQEEVRDILISIGEIIPSDKLKSEDPVVQKRINMLKKWRYEKSRFENMPPYVYLTNKCLLAVAENNPKSNEDLLLIAGIGTKKVASFGAEILNLLKILEN